MRISGVRGEFAEALDEYQAALACFRTVGDVENEAGIHPLMLEMFEFVGERDQAWIELELGLSRLTLVRDFRCRHNILQQASLIALRSEWIVGFAKQLRGIGEPIVKIVAVRGPVHLVSTYEALHLGTIL